MMEDSAAPSRRYFVQASYTLEFDTIMEPVDFEDAIAFNADESVTRTILEKYTHPLKRPWMEVRPLLSEPIRSPESDFRGGIRPGCLRSRNAARPQAQQADAEVRLLAPVSADVSKLNKGLPRSLASELLNSAP